MGENVVRALLASGGTLPLEDASPAGAEAATMRSVLQPYIAAAIHCRIRRRLAAPT